MKVIKSIHCVERRQTRFPKSKKFRIRKKWAKREANHIYIPKAFQMGDTFYMHPTIYEQLRLDDLTKYQVFDPVARLRELALFQ